MMDRFRDSQSRWMALTRRDPTSHSSFLYGVRSTRIYCRPTCSSRLARRANVVYFDTEDEAKRGGFRPCKRCKPDNSNFKGDKEELVSKVLALLRTRKDDQMVKVSLGQVAEDVGVTQSYLCRVFAKTMGITLSSYMKEFERGASVALSPTDTESSIAASGSVLETAATTPLDPFTPLEAVESGSDVEFGATALCDLDFDFNDWLWTDDFSYDSTYGWKT